MLRELKKRRDREHKPLGQIASELLTQAMGVDDDAPSDFTWTSKNMGAQVDLEDKEAVRSALERT